MRTLGCLCLCATALAAADWHPLCNGRNLDGWEVRGDGIWSVTAEGVVVGQRPHGTSNPFQQWPVPRADFAQWFNQQAWLYTNAEYEEFDLSLEYFLPIGGNSGVSIRDTSRARYAFLPDWDPKRTPSHIGYEIQLLDGASDRFPSGSIYLFTAAPAGLHKPHEWNRLEIESRREKIRVKVNGTLAAEGAGDPERSKKGPIGLQLHDRVSWVMFRNIRIRTR